MVRVEAASVALARRHVPPTSLAVQDDSRATAIELEWLLPTEALLRSFRGEDVATWLGAELIGIACVETLRRMVVVWTARRGEHVDFYVGPPGTSLEAAAVVEVGGTQDGSIAAVLAAKRRQASENEDRLPATAVAVRFLEPRAILATVERDQT